MTGTPVRASRIVLVCLLPLLPAAGAGATAALAAPANEDCLACHDDVSATRADGTSIAVDAEAFGASIHAFLSCTDCHADLADAELPHDEKLAAVDCSSCHADAAAAYGRSVHALARSNGQPLAASCVDCHGKHEILPSSDDTSRTWTLNIPKTCGRCHGTIDVINAASTKEGDVYGAFLQSVHGKGLVESGLLVSAECTDCHGFHDVRAKSDPESGINPMNLPATCGKCHHGIEEPFVASVHGQKLLAGDPKAPTCEDCHTAHRIRRAEIGDWQLSVLDECGTCHEQSLTTYRDTFHGQVTNLGFTRVATCASCHGSHDIKPEIDPASRVSGDRRVETCRRCHPSANANFAAYDPHADRHDRERNPYLYWAGLFMEWLLIGVFAFFGVHTALWFTREVRAHGGVRGMRKAGPDVEGH